VRTASPPFPPFTRVSTSSAYKRQRCAALGRGGGGGGGRGGGGGGGGPRGPPPPPPPSPHTLRTHLLLEPPADFGRCGSSTTPSDDDDDDPALGNRSWTTCPSTMLTCPSLNRRALRYTTSSGPAGCDAAPPVVGEDDDGGSGDDVVVAPGKNFGPVPGTGDSITSGLGSAKTSTPDSPNLRERERVWVSAWEMMVRSQCAHFERWATAVAVIISRCLV
jgi:hypothetical protein